MASHQVRILSPGAGACSGRIPQQIRGEKPASLILTNVAVFKDVCRVGKAGRLYLSLCVLPLKTEDSRNPDTHLPLSNLRRTQTKLTPGFCA